MNFQEKENADIPDGETRRERKKKKKKRKERNETDREAYRDAQAEIEKVLEPTGSKEHRKSKSPSPAARFVIYQNLPAQQSSVHTGYTITDIGWANYFV